MWLPWLPILFASIICDYAINVQNGVHQAVRVLTWILSTQEWKQWRRISWSHSTLYLILRDVESCGLSGGTQDLWSIKHVRFWILWMLDNVSVFYCFLGSSFKKCTKCLGPSLLIQSQSLHPKKCRSMHGPMAGREHKRFRLCLFDLHWLWWSFFRTSWSVLGTLTAGVTRAADALVLAVSHKKTMQDSAVATIDGHHGKNSSLGCNRSMLKWFCSCRQ